MNVSLCTEVSRLMLNISSLSIVDKIKEGKDKLIDDIAKLRFEIGMRKMSMGKLAGKKVQNA